MKVHEVPFRFTISGTLLVEAEDEAHAKTFAEERLQFEPDLAEESEAFFDQADDDPVILKDGLRGSVQIDQPYLSTTVTKMPERKLEYPEDAADGPQAAPSFPNVPNQPLDSKQVKREAPPTPAPKPAPASAPFTGNTRPTSPPKPAAPSAKK